MHWLHEPSVGLFAWTPPAPENGKGGAKLIYTAVQPPERTYLLLDRSIGSSHRQLQYVFAATPGVTKPPGSHSRIRLLVKGTFTATKKQTTWTHAVRAS